jgi:hypothetical protein
MKTVKQVLEEAKAVIADPGRWIKHHYTTYETLPPRACAMGAMYLVDDGSAEMLETFTAARDLLQKEARTRTHYRNFLNLHFYSVEEFNDYSATTHDDVLKLYDDAIAKAP